MNGNSFAVSRLFGRKWGGNLQRLVTGEKKSVRRWVRQVAGAKERETGREWECEWEWERERERERESTVCCTTCLSVPWRCADGEVAALLSQTKIRKGEGRKTGASKYRIASKYQKARERDIKGERRERGGNWGTSILVTRINISRQEQGSAEEEEGGEEKKWQDGEKSADGRSLMVQPAWTWEWLPILVSAFLSAPLSSLSLVWPCPLLLHPPLPPLSHTLSLSLSLYLSLSSHSQTGESGLPGLHLCLYISFSAFSPTLLIVILQLKPCKSIPQARHQRQDTGEGKTALEINWGFPQRTVESFVLFRLFWWLTCSAASLPEEKTWNGRLDERIKKETEGKLLQH